MPKDAYWNIITLQIWYTRRCLLKSHNHLKLDIIKCAYWPKKIHIEWKCVFWPKMCLLNKKVYIDQKDVYWEMQRHNYLVFLNVYMSLIYITTWCNKECSTKSQTVCFYIILVTNPCDARRIATKWVSKKEK